MTQPTQPKASTVEERLIREIMNRYGRRTLLHAVLGVIKVRELGWWKKMEVTLNKTLNKQLTTLSEQIRDEERERLEKDLKFLKEMQKYSETPTNLTDFEMVQIMIADWINELESLTQKDVR